jgi:hypothetical protein
VVKSKKKRDEPHYYLTTLEDIPPEYRFLSEGSKVFNYNSTYPIFFLNHKDKQGTWLKLKEAIDKMDERSDQISEKDIEDFLDNHPEIDFELEMFEDVLNESFYFKIDDNIYCYSIKELSKSHLMVRFFFDIQKFIC